MTESFPQTQPSVETKVTYGLRLKETGELVRMGTTTTAAWGGEDPVYFLSRAAGDPVFDAGSAEALAQVFLVNDGISELRPHLRGITKSQVDPVILTEVITRTVEAAPIPFEDNIPVNVVRTLTVEGQIVDQVEGLRDIFELVVEYKAELKAAHPEGRGWRGGDFNINAYVLREKVEDLSHIVPGSRICTSPGFDRRVLAVRDLPEDLLVEATRGAREHIPYFGSLVICLSDWRKLPAKLQETLEARYPSVAPSSAPVL